ncbi:MAG: hypothetical protein QG570_600 [Patescibacteria group bacterium]|nr:hypothetical protein [Patescibacteria group bacterium]
MYSPDRTPVRSPLDELKLLANIVYRNAYKIFLYTAVLAALIDLLSNVVWGDLIISFSKIFVFLFAIIFIYVRSIISARAGRQNYIDRLIFSAALANWVISFISTLNQYSSTNIVESAYFISESGDTILNSFVLGPLLVPVLMVYFILPLLPYLLLVDKFSIVNPFMKKLMLIGTFFLVYGWLILLLLFTTWIKPYVIQLSENYNLYVLVYGPFYLLLSKELFIAKKQKLYKDQV